MITFNRTTKLFQGPLGTSCRQDNRKKAQKTDVETEPFQSQAILALHKSLVSLCYNNNCSHVQSSRRASLYGLVDMAHRLQLVYHLGHYKWNAMAYT